MKQRDFQKALQPLKRKMILQNGIKSIFWVMTVAGIVSLILAGLSLFIVIPFIRYKILLTLVFSVPAAFMVTCFLFPSWKQVMITADNLGLKERIITAWYLRADPSPVARLQREDAQKALSSANLKSSYRVSVEKRYILSATVLFIIAFGLSFIPGKVSRQTQLREALITEMNEQQKVIVDKVKEEQEKHNDLSEAQLEALQEALEKLKEDLKQARTEEEALKGLAQMENLMEQFQSQEPLQDLKALEDALAGSPATEELADALKNEDYKALKEALEQLKKELAEGLSQEEITALVEKAAANMSDNSMLAQAIQNLAASASTGSMGAGEMTERLSELLEQTANNAKGQQAFQQAAGEIGKASSSARRTIAQVDPNMNGGESKNNGSQAAQGEGNPSGRQGQGQGEGQSQGQSQGQGEGQSQGQGQGQGQSQGQGQGQDQGQDQGQGQGQGGGAGAGEGSTSEDQGYSEGDRPGSGRMPGSRKENEYERIYVPERLGGEGNETALTGQKLESGSSTFSEADGAPVQKGAMVPWQEVLTQYREEAVQSMDSQEIPPGLKELVRDYFSSLE